MKTYIRSIQFSQKLFLLISILIMLLLPLIIVFYPEHLSEQTILRLYDISHFTVFFVMVIRPLADIFKKTTKIRPLVILRKSIGVLSASIVLSFIFSKIIIDPIGYFQSFATLKYWSFENLAVLAHLADISAFLLVITSNTFSKRILGLWWKRIQRLSYVYFYASSIYVFFIFEHTSILFSMTIVTLLTSIAYIQNKKLKSNNIQTQ